MLIYITQCAKTTLVPITVRGLPLWHLGVGGGFFARRRAAAYLRRLYASGVRRGVFEDERMAAMAARYGIDPIPVLPLRLALLDRLLDAEETDFDLIRCNEDLALNVCSVGLDARIGTDVASYKRLPLLQGFRAYAVSALVNVIRGIGEHYRIRVNGETIEGEKTMVCVCNGRFYGGGFNPVPDADPADGILDILLVEKVSRLQVAGIIGKYKNGRYRDYPNLIRHIRAREIEIVCEAPTAINLDGELRRASTIHISIAPEKIRFFYPRNLTWQARISANT